MICRPFLTISFGIRERLKEREEKTYVDNVFVLLKELTEKDT